MQNFWDFSVWGSIHLFALLLLTIFVAHILKNNIPFLEKSLIPTSVLGGLLLLAVSAVYEHITGVPLYNIRLFGGSGDAFSTENLQMMEVMTYHMLALGFIAKTLGSGSKKFGKQRAREVFDSGVTTVSSYLLQGIIGLGITLLAALVSSKIFRAAGVLLPFGFGQGSGQALNWGNIYENDNGFVGGRSFGLTIAALGFLAASVGGVIHLNILRRQGRLPQRDAAASASHNDADTPHSEGMDGLTVQLALVVITYSLTYFALHLLGCLLPGMKSTIFGFNFLFGVLVATLVKAVINAMRKKNLVRKRYIDSYLMDRVSGVCFDLMVVAGIAAIRIEVLADYWWVVLALAVLGTLATYFYVRYVSRRFFPAYSEEQFLVMYGMLTGTASTGMILLREIDPACETPAADNLVYQQFPAIAFGFPLMILAPIAPYHPVKILLLFVAFFAVMNIILFRSAIFRRKKKESSHEAH